MSKYCEECKDCHKGKTCTLISSDCVLYDGLDVPIVSKELGRNYYQKSCVTIQNTNDDIYTILTNLNSLTEVVKKDITDKCDAYSSLSYKPDSTTLTTQKEFNLKTAELICKLLDRTEKEADLNKILNSHINNEFNIPLNCLNINNKDCNGVTIPITFRHLIQAIINKLCE